jgi:thiamine transport system substrate-binding protein
MKKTTLMIIMAFFWLSACAPQAASLPSAATPTTAPVPPTAPEPATQPSEAPTLTVMTHDSFAASETIIRQFEETNHVKLAFIKSGDSGSMLNRAVLSKDTPLADVMYGVDNAYLTRALDAGIYETYASPLLKDIPAEFKLDEQNRALPVDYGDVCINYDKAYFTQKNLSLPQSLEDLAKPEYKGLFVVENPAVSSPGMAFLLATIAHFGPDKYLDYWKSLRANSLVIVNDWETAYYTNFSASSGHGSQPMIVSYGSSPVAEVIFASPPLKEAITASIVSPDTCFRQVEFVGILKGSKQRPLAEKFVDFMLSQVFQEDMPMQMFVYPVNSHAKLPAEFQQFAQMPEKLASVSPSEIAKNREKWVQDWSEVMLH